VTATLLKNDVDKVPTLSRALICRVLIVWTTYNATWRGPRRTRSNISRSVTTPDSDWLGLGYNSYAAARGHPGPMRLLGYVGTALGNRGALRGRSVGVVDPTSCWGEPRAFASSYFPVHLKSLVFAAKPRRSGITTVVLGIARHCADTAREQVPTIELTSEITSADQSMTKLSQTRPELLGSVRTCRQQRRAR